jgi:hypothetical protein
LGVVSSLVDDPSPDIRRDVARLLAGAYRDGKNEQLASGLRQLLQDDNWEIKKEAMDALAQSPEHAEEMEDLAIELSKDPEHANEMMGWLARRPTINAKLATHLVEMIEEEGGPSHILHTSLTRWGGPVLSDEARAIFSDFCLRTLKDSISPGRRLQALETLKMTGDDWALSELEEIALGPDAEGVEDIIAATIEHLKRKGDGQR